MPDSSSLIGQTISHYHVLEKIGAGGMGVVYRAHDTQLDRDVAIKALPPGMIVDEAARKQFRKEALALAKLNHPNIETVHEFGSQDGTDFLVMELILGDTLSSKLMKGPLDEPQVLRLGKQIGEGLAAAHKQGVIHCDLKPGNIIVTSDGHAKILDFGLAKLLQPEADIATTESLTHHAAGTLPYMAPEQLRCERPNARTDIYAAGVVLYEMTSGKRPFPETQSPRLIDAILHKTPAPPSSHNRLTSGALEAVIRKAMEKEPSQRYESARELVVALEGVATGSVPAQTPPHRSLTAAMSLALLVVLSVGLILGFNVGGLRDRLAHRALSGGIAANAAATPAPIHTRPSIAVLGFKNVSGRADEDWLSNGLEDTMDSELSAGEQLRIISGENVARMKTELVLPDADSYSTETLHKIRNNLGSDYVVEGSFIALGSRSSGQIRVDVKLQDTRTGETIASVIETGLESNTNSLFAKTGSDLRAKLGVASPAAVEESAARASLPSNPDAARYYSEGLLRVRRFDALPARDLLEKAVAAEPSFALSHFALAAALAQLGYAAKGRDESEAAFNLSKNLSREERLLVEAGYREAKHDWTGAAEDYRTLFGFFPDNLVYGFRLAFDLTGSGKAQDGLASCETLRKLPSPLGDDPLIDICAANAAEKLGNFKLEQLVSAAGAKKAEARGERVLEARALKLECWATHRLGDPTQAMNLCSQTRQIYLQLGYTNPAAGVLLSIGSIQTSVGDKEGAKASYLAAEAAFRRVGDMADLAVSDNNLGNIYYAYGDFQKAIRFSEAAETGYREAGNDRGVSIALDNHADMLQDLGDLAGAERLQMESLVIARRIGNSEGASMTLNSLSSVHHSQGKISSAKQDLDEARTANIPVGSKSVLSSNLFQQGVLLKDGDHLQESRHQLEQSLAIRKETGEKGEAAEIALEIGALDIEEGAPANAEAAARSSLEEFRTEKLPADEVSALSLLELALLAEGKFAEAQKEADDAAPLVAACQAREKVAGYSVTHARILAASHHDSAASASLSATVAEAHKFGFVPEEFEARLALGEIEMKSGKQAQGHARLTTLEKDATAKEFFLIARHAHAAAAAN